MLGSAFKPDHDHAKRIIEYYTDSIQAMVDAGDINELAKAIDVRPALLALIELLDYAEEFKSQD